MRPRRPTTPPSITHLTGGLAAGLIALFGVVALGTGCAGSSPDRVTTPSTDADPPTFIPAPVPVGTPEHLAGEPEDNGPVSIRVGDGHAQAVAITTRFLRALTDRDAPTLEELLAPTIARLLPRLSPPAHPREQFVRAMVQPRSRPGATNHSPSDLYDLARARTVSLADYQENRPIPDGIEPTDLVVTVPLTSLGQSELQFMDWRIVATVLVREGARPVVLGF